MIDSEQQFEHWKLPVSQVTNTPFLLNIDFNAPQELFTKLFQTEQERKDNWLPGEYIAIAMFNNTLGEIFNRDAAEGTKIQTLLFNPSLVISLKTIRTEIGISLKAVLTSLNCSMSHPEILYAGNYYFIERAKYSMSERSLSQADNELLERFISSQKESMLNIAQNEPMNNKTYRAALRLLCTIHREDQNHNVAIVKTRRSELLAYIGDKTNMNNPLNLDRFYSFLKHTYPNDTFINDLENWD